MERNKNLAQAQILVTISVAIMIMGTEIATAGPQWYILGWVFLLAGAGFFIWALVNFSKIK